MGQVGLEHLLWPQPGSRKQRLGGHQGGTGLNCSLAWKLCQPVTRRRTEAPSHSGTVAGSLARKLAFADPWPEVEGQE